MASRPADALRIREIREACARAGIADVDVSRRRRAEYSTDASLYRVVPAAVVAPRDADEVAAVLDVARRLEIPVTARGGGTSIAGNAVGPGIVLDVARHLNRIIRVDPEAATAVVQPGVVLSDLQAAAAPHGLRFGPDPSTLDRCTLGGMIGNDACGPRALRYGRTSDNVRGLEVVTGGGDRLGLAPAPDGQRPAGPTGSLLAAVDAMQPLVRAEFGRFSRQISGYPLHRLLPEHGRDLAKAAVGTEGTWAVVTGATLDLVRSPAATSLLVLGYPDIAAAADAVPDVLAYRPIAIEGLDARIVDAVRRAPGAASVPDMPDGTGWLLVEFGADTAQEAAARAAELQAAVTAQGTLLVTDPAAAARIWAIRRDGAGLSSRSPAGRPAHSGWEDAAVPPARLGAYLREFERLLADRGLTGIPYGHFGEGCLHIRVDVALGAVDGRARLRTFLEEAADLVVSHGGSMSGEHGDGRARSGLLRRMYSDEAMELMAQAKRCFDPDGILNPGVIVDAAAPDADVRLLAAPPLRERLGFTYPAELGDFSEAVHRCVGIAACRADTTASGGVMCPSYFATRDEKDSTRGRARVLQEMINGSLVTGGWQAPEVHESLDLCLACKACASECPAGVDMATYKSEVLHQTYRGRLRPRSHYTLGRLPRWLRLAGRFPRLLNAAGSLPPAARVVTWLAGMDRRRPVPRLAPRPYSRLARSRPRRAAAPAPDAPVAVLWVDTFTEHFAPSAAIAAAEVLEAAGYRVEVPRRPGCCGLTWISTGQLDQARRIVARTVARLERAAAAGAVIVGLEPSCTAVLRHDARQLLGPGHRGATAVAAVTRTVAEALAARRPEWTPPRLDGVEVIAQPHCHHRSIMGWEADAALLAETGATVRTLGGCCGMAGNFGVERGHYEVSAGVAELALLPALREAGANTVVLADGFSCRTQVEQLAGHSSVHLAELLTRRRPTAQDV